ncbi:MAG: hypothetical protein CBD16_03825 [Betaproteobacteria bacterium TMED156]|nr:MAG: hypothetical protein CBD16_03825 [Betaproteobacteria bacterium TMED156]
MKENRKRHRSQFDPDNQAPYELSRSRIENFIKCPACFYLQQVKGVKYPSIPGFNINEATDILLKRDFDQYRGKTETHPFLIKRGMSHVVPYQHDDFELWTQSLHFGSEGRMHTVHEPSNIKFGGGLDDIWRNTQTDELHIVDYKSTSQKTKGKQITLDDKWKAAYKRQMDMYVWIMRQKDFNVSSTGYFLYCDGDRFSDYEFLCSDEAVMKFKISLIPYTVNTDWIEPTLLKIRKCLLAKDAPAHYPDCEYGRFIDAVAK